MLHLDELKWSVPALPAGGQAWPSARSGCQVSVNGDTMFVYGGYSKVGQGEGRQAGIDGLLSKRKQCLPMVESVGRGSWCNVGRGVTGLLGNRRHHQRETLRS